MKYMVHEDPGHGWLAVPRKELKRLGILKEISKCSYQKGKTVYLEEDNDAPKFVNAKAALNEACEFVYSKNRHCYTKYSPIRSYQNFQLAPDEC